jgi:hypothetical protein
MTFGVKRARGKTSTVESKKNIFLGKHLYKAIPSHFAKTKTKLSFAFAFAKYRPY